MHNNTGTPFRDVFISYRRDGGSAYAGLLNRELRNHGLTAFLDTQAIGSGEFAKAIELSIKRSRNFLFLLTPGCFKRCFEPQGVDHVLIEINIAHAFRQECVNNHSAERADNIFRIVPVFLGDDLNNYSTYKSSHPDTWDLLNLMFGDKGHNGIKLSDASSFGSELEKLISVMLLNRSRVLVSELVSQSVSDDDEGLRQGLEELFSAYLDMYSSDHNGQGEYTKIRDYLSPMVHDRLMEIIVSGDEPLLKNALKSFRLCELKDACVQFDSKELSDYLGSRDRVITNAIRWLSGHDQIIEEKQISIGSDQRPSLEKELKSPLLLRDRLDVIKEYFVEALRKNKNVTRAGLVAAIKEEMSSNTSLRNFRPSNWKEWNAIVSELFDHLSYPEVSEFLRKNWWLIKDSKDNSAEVLTYEQKRSRGIHLTDLHRIIWGLVQQHFKISISPKSAERNWPQYVRHIEDFLSYKNPYILSKSDLVHAPAEQEDAEPETDPKDAFDQLVMLLRRKFMRREREGYRSLMISYLMEYQEATKVPKRNLYQLLQSSLRIDRGEFLHRLSMKGLSRSLKFQRDDWKEFCLALDINVTGEISSLINAIQEKVFGSPVLSVLQSEDPEFQSDPLS